MAFFARIPHGHGWSVVMGGLNLHPSLDGWAGTAFGAPISGPVSSEDDRDVRIGNNVVEVGSWRLGHKDHHLCLCHAAMGTIFLWKFDGDHHGEGGPKPALYNTIPHWNAWHWEFGQPKDVYVGDRVLKMGAFQFQEDGAGDLSLVHVPDKRLLMKFQPGHVDRAIVENVEVRPVCPKMV